MESEIYTSIEKLLGSVCGSAENGFVSCASLLSFENELNESNEPCLLNTKKIILKEAVGNTWENLYAMAEATIRAGKTGFLKDFGNYQSEAELVAEKYGLNKKNIIDKFNEIWRGK